VRVPLWAVDLASRFWDEVGAEADFPRDLEDAIDAALPVTVKRLPGLTLTMVREWLAPLEIIVDESTDRALCGCLAANRGEAFLFVDANDPPSEQRYTVAHELAHYLRDVRRPRQRIERTLGAAGLEIADGLRSASVDDRLSAALDDVDLSIRLHLLSRDAEGRPATADIADAEDSADALAYELLAPAQFLAE
jgi:hypothetical protein